jgi:polysaccharide export outer membrane protein
LTDRRADSADMDTHSRCAEPAPRCSAHLLCAGLLLAFVSGCASLPEPPRVARAWHETLPGVARDEHPQEQVRVGDRIVIAVGDRAGTAERTVWVEGNGRAHVASGQDVAVAGLSVKSAEAKIAEAVRTRDKFALVDIRLAATSAQQAVVLGAVTSPGRAAVLPAMRVSGLVAAKGGLIRARVTTGGRIASSPADLSGARLLRNGTALPIDLERALLGEPGHDVLVHPGDILYVPFANANGIAVFGMVGRPDMVPYRARMRLTEALASAGGMDDQGDKDDVRIVRGPVDAPIAYGASLVDIADEDGPDVALLPGDVVFVEDKLLEDIGEVLGLLAPFATVVTTSLVTTLILMQQR